VSPAPKQSLGRISVASTQHRLRVPASRVRRLVEFVARQEHQKLDQVDILIVGRQRMASLNAQLLGHRGPTDVISLDLGAGPAGGCARSSSSAPMWPRPNPAAGVCRPGKSCCSTSRTDCCTRWDTMIKLKLRREECIREKMNCWTRLESDRYSSAKIRNSKLEIRNKPKAPNPKPRNSSNGSFPPRFVFWISFGFRISNFGFASQALAACAALPCLSAVG
jgi:hypothetical protein